MSHNSPRSLRIKQQARDRADVTWRDSQGLHQQKVSPTSSPIVLTGGSELTQLIAKSDINLLKMRKVVQ